MHLRICRLSVGRQQSRSAGSATTCPTLTLRTPQRGAFPSKMPFVDENYEIDGFRLDAVKHIEQVWLTDLRDRITQKSRRRHQTAHLPCR